MKLAINYSDATAGLLADGAIAFDTFKCPAWPDLIATAQAFRPVNVHFPLLVGAGIGDAIDGETGAPADWARVEALLSQTGTPLVNVHLGAATDDYPGIPADTEDPAHAALVTERLITDVAAVVRRFGAERVIAENNPPGSRDCIRPAYLPAVISRVIRETGCGLLLDLAHVRLAAEALDMSSQSYAAALPVDRIREIHVTGVQPIAGRWVERLQQHGVGPEMIQQYAGRRADHLPMTDEDWPFFEWAVEQIRAGAWREPWIVTFEYGGVGLPWEALTDADALRAQIPRLRKLLGDEASGGD